MSNVITALIDTHCHIDLFAEPTAIIKEAEKNSIYTIAVTNTPSVFPHTESFARNTRYTRAAVGLHPELAVARRRELPQMWDFIKRTQYVGEIGLDYRTQDELNRQVQREVFERILRKCADYGNKVLTVHSRQAATDVISIIGNNYAGRVILHWYSGSLRDLRKAIDYGFYFSVNIAMTKSKKGQRLIVEIPQNRLLTETDGPFVRIDNAPCSPSTVVTTIASMSSLLKISPGQLRMQILNNFRHLLADSPDAENHKFV